jgi:hypothetical protein
LKATSTGREFMKHTAVLQLEKGNVPNLMKRKQQQSHQMSAGRRITAFVLTLQVVKQQESVEKTQEIHPSCSHISFEM